MDKKGALELGINTIVILVIAMVVIAAGIAFIRQFFQLGEDKLKEPFNLADFGIKPTSTEPLVIQSGDLTVTSGKQTEFKVGYFNKENSPQQVVQVVMGLCTTTCTTSPDGMCKVQPQLLSVAKTTVASGEATGFRVLLTAKDANAGGSNIPKGTYICTMKATSNGVLDPPLAEIQMTMTVNI